MKRLLLLLAIGVATLRAIAADFTNETLHYDVSYKWGLIHKHAGTALIKLNVNGDNCRATLYGRTDPWADKFFSVRDTLISQFSRSSMLPTEYHRIANEDGAYAHDIVKFSKYGSTVNGTTVCNRRKKKETSITTTTHSMTAQGATVDLLSSFYYLRSLDFAKLNSGYTETISIFSGKKKERLKITYKGKVDIKIGEHTYPTYHVVFTFTTDGAKKSSEPIDAWISTDSRRIPLKMEGALKIGKIRCILGQ